MRKTKLTLCLLLLLGLLPIVSCSKHSDTPVDQIVELLDQAIDKTKDITSMAELTNVRNIISPKDVWTIIDNNSDYKLTKKDKEKLKKSYNELVKVAFEKTCEFVNSEDLKKNVKSQLDLMLEGIDRNIDQAETLGEIRALN